MGILRRDTVYYASYVRQKLNMKLIIAMTFMCMVEVIVAATTQGPTCETDADCSTDALCGNDGVGLPYYCHTKLADGEPCELREQRLCLSGKCDAATQVCSAQDAMGPLCTAASDCADYQFCSSDCDGCANWCHDKYVAGDTCYAADLCVSGACTGGVCAEAPKAAG